MKLLATFLKSRLWLVVPLLCATTFLNAVRAQIAYRDTILTQTDTVIYWAQIPAGYSPAAPPAMLIWWHQLGGNQLECSTHTVFDTEANERGWICASHFGPNDRHYNTQRAQLHCKLMLDEIMQDCPFSMDSIYMIGGSMGGASGQIWHNNNCGPDDYFIAAHAGGSQILDCQLRQEQYLSAGDTNRSMRAAFGGLPGESDSIDWAYHRASAVFAADTTESMHFNSLHLPVWNTWGNNAAENTAYGLIGLIWDSLRRADNADSTLMDTSDIAGHGLQVMPADSVCNWLSGFAANRYPDIVSINADENDSYYWTDVEVIGSQTFGRYSVRKDSAQRRIEVNYVRNVASITVNFDFPWSVWDTLSCAVTIGDTPIETTTLILDGVRLPSDVYVLSGEPIISYEYDWELLRLIFHLAASGEFFIDFRGSAEPHPEIPLELKIAGAYPNPFNSTVVFEIQSPKAVQQTITLYNILGREVLSKDVNLTIGSQRVLLNAEGLTSGTYYARLNSISDVQKIVLIR